MSVPWQLLCNLRFRHGTLTEAQPILLWARPSVLFCKQPRPLMTPHLQHFLFPVCKSSRYISHLQLSAFKGAGGPTFATNTPQTDEDGNDTGIQALVEFDDDGGDHDTQRATKFSQVQLKDPLRTSPVSSATSTSLACLSSARVRGILLLNLLTFLYGTNIPIIKEAEAVANPSLFLCGRFALATMVLAPFIVGGIKDCEVRKASLELGLWISMGYWTQSISLLSTDAGRASFISAFTVIVVPLLAGLSGREISKATWASAIMAFTGVGLLETSGSPATVGDFWSLSSAVLFGVHMLRTEHYSRAISSRKLLPMLGTQLLVITLSSLLFSYIASPADYWFKGLSFSSLSNIVDVQPALVHFPWLPLIYTGTVSTAFCLWIELTAMRDISATDTAVIYSLEPLWGAAFAWCFLGERWGLKGWLGALLIFGGSLAVQFSQLQESKESSSRND
ncbi:hypothetical protein GOP47_0013890 [Adiantum capillus-veneris]|uniref:EamA domain-containing protein n=1 Tax=Adiantum capillus-veneris TaxID=13818 RepID=A0A9D4UPW1_ADICA|nr:hypothetical protein GOP47_0013890 [Adiantum capillus-veneris]